jgi:hypothetical protein
MNRRRARRSTTALVMVALAVAVATACEIPLPPTYYFVDCTAGNDANAGTTSTTAWKTLTKASKATPSPGDSLQLKRGCTWSGQLLDLSWTGTEAKPITVGTYGEGAAPRIRNATYQNVRVNGSYIVVQDLDLGFDVRSRAACGQPIGDYNAFVFGPGSHHNTVQRTKLSGATAGVFISGTSHHNSVLNNTISGNNVMKIWNGDPEAALGAFGVLINGSDNEIANNTFTANIATCPTHADWYPSNSVEIYLGSRNKVHHNRSTDRVFSELGSSASTRATANEFSYNLFTPTIAHSFFIITRGAKDTAFGPVPGTIVAHNTTYQTGAGSQAVVCGSGCTSSVLTVRSNILWAEDKVLYADDALTESHNIYWNRAGAPFVQIERKLATGGVQVIPISTTSKLADPRFTNPATPNFTPRSTSPALNAGHPTVLYPTDLASTPVPQAGIPDIGSFEIKTP